MKFDVTRNVVSDLWPLCQSGDASADSRALVDAYLADDAGFASVLRESEQLGGAMPSLRLSPDAERHRSISARNSRSIEIVPHGAEFTPDKKPGVLFISFTRCVIGPLIIRPL